jgi:hypothetical protein
LLLLGLRLDQQSSFFITPHFLLCVFALKRLVVH